MKHVPGGRTLLGDRWPMWAIGMILVTSVAFVFWRQIAGLEVFIGESDRLNSYLNMRLAEYDALQEYGRVPTWSSSTFGGSPTVALHWMNPGQDPLAYLLQLFPRRDLFQVLGYVVVFLILASCVTAFLYIHDVTRADGPSVVAALAYGLSVFSLHRVAQVDNAHLTVILIPLALLALRRSRIDNLLEPFIALTLIMGALAFLGFLQEVAYGFIFFGAYTIYRMVTLVRSQLLNAVPPLLVMGSASTIALLFAAPRLVTVAGEFSLLSRTETLHYRGYSQILRFFHEGIYGRYFEEGRLLAHGMNLHEGLQLVSSTTLSLIVCLGIIRPKTRFEAVGALLFAALLSAMLPTPDLLLRTVHRFSPIHTTSTFSDILANGSAFLVFVLAVIASDRKGTLRASLRRVVPVAPRPTDTTFHVFALTIVLFATLVPEGADIVYRMFGRVDFTHTRLSILAVLPLCTLFAIYLSEIKTLPLYHNAHIASVDRHKAFLLIGGAATVSYLIHGTLLDYFIPRNAVRMLLLEGNELMPTVALRVLLTAALLGSGALLVALARSPAFDLRYAATLVIATFVVVESLTYAQLKMAGPQTRTYPIPFRTFNYLNVDPAIMRPPENSKLAKFKDTFEVDSDRFIVLSDNKSYPGVNIPHIAAFWSGRTIGGYGTGVSQRLAALPWPKGVQTLRTIDFTSTRNLDASIFPLLAFLNVKYLLVLTPDVYFNIASANKAHAQDPPSLTLGGTEYPLRTVDILGTTFLVLENPIRVLPRYFLVERVKPVDLPPVSLSPERSKAPGTRIRIFEGQTDDLTRTSFVEHYDRGTTAFDTSGNLSVSYQGDVIEIRVTPSPHDRFLVLNESFHPRWRAYVDTRPIDIYPTNLIMQGFVIPPDVDRVHLRFEPLSSSLAAHIMMALAVMGFVGVAVWLRNIQSRQRGAP